MKNIVETRHYGQICIIISCMLLELGNRHRFRNLPGGAQLLFIPCYNIIIVLQSDHFLNHYNESSDSKASITALTIDAV